MAARKTTEKGTPEKVDMFGNIQKNWHGEIHQVL